MSPQCCFSLLLLISCCIGQELLNNTALDLTFPQGFDYESLTWAGALGGRRGGRGCSATQLPAQLEVACVLPAGGLTLTVDRAGNELTLRCEDDTYNCDELAEARADISQYVTSDANRTVQRLTIDNCVLPDSPVRCVLDAVPARDAAVLVLRHVRGELRARHLAGLRAVHSVWLRDLAANVTSLPYDALATLPALRRCTALGGGGRPARAGGAALAALSALELIDGDVPAVRRGDFRRTPALRRLMLVGSRVRDIEEHAFDDIPLLVNVSLESNLLSAVPGALFAGTPLLRTADLYGNRLAALPATLFRGLAHLTEVNVFGNKETLRLEDGVFSELPSLRSVDLHSTAVAPLPADLFSNSTDIQTINLSDTNLATLPEQLFLSNLKLETLDLSHNVIEELPATVLRGTTSLVSLDLSYNKFKVLPLGLFDSLRDLKILRVNNNQIEYLDDNIFQGLGNLEQLYLNSNKLRTLSSRTFELVPNLQVLSLSHNELSFPQPVAPPTSYQELELFSPLAGLKRLRRLDLAHNRLAAVCDDWRYLLHLQDLDLSYNLITELNNPEFLSAARVDVRHNNVTAVSLRPLLPDESPDQSPHLWLDRNPFRCDCGLYSFTRFRRDAAHLGRLHIDDARCAEPPELADVRLADLSVDMLTCEFGPCPAGCRCRERPARLRLELDCDRLPELLPAAPERCTGGVALRLRSLARLAPLPADVRLLNISGLNLTEAPSLASSIRVDLRDNRLTAAPAELLRRNCSLYLAGNPLRCDCDHRDGLLELRRLAANVLDYPRLVCDGGAPLPARDAAHLCALRLAVTVAAAALALAAVAVGAAAAAYRHRAVVRLVLRKAGLRCADADRAGGDGLEYDAFVSYAHQDEAVAARLVARLEGGAPALRLCTHARDWLPGEPIAEQICRSVERSRRTVVVLSRHFARSHWARLEFLAAHSRGRAVLLVVDDVLLSAGLSAEIKAYVSLNTYIHIDDPFAVERVRDAVLAKSRWGGLIKVKGRGGGGGGGEREGGQGALDVRVGPGGKLVNGAAVK